MCRNSQQAVEFSSSMGLSFSPAQENKSVTSQCSAFVRVVSKSGEIFKSQIWTARHCLPDFSSRIVRSYLRLFDGRNAYVQLDISLSLAQARDGFFNLVAAKIPEFIDTDKKKQKNPARIALNYTFLEEEGKKNYGAECKRNGASETVSETLLCSALQDFRLFDADIRPKTKIGSEILNSLLTRENDSNRRGATESIVKQWQLAVTRQMEMELDISRGRFVDMLLQCSKKHPQRFAITKTHCRFSRENGEHRVAISLLKRRKMDISNQEKVILNIRNLGHRITTTAFFCRYFLSFRHQYKTKIWDSFLLETLLMQTENRGSFQALP